jgi:hypothetical protein
MNVTLQPTAKCRYAGYENIFKRLIEVALSRSQDVYLDKKGKLVENFRVAAFGHIDGDQTPLHYAASRD